MNGWFKEDDVKVLDNVYVELEPTRAQVATTMPLGVNSVKRFSFHLSSDAHDSMTNDRCYLHWRTGGSTHDLVFTRVRACTTTMSIAVVYMPIIIASKAAHFTSTNIDSS